MKWDWEVTQNTLTTGTSTYAVCVTWYPSAMPLQWRHNEHDSVSNHQPHVCLLNRLFGRRSKKTSKLRVTGLCVGNSPGTGEFPAQMASNAENVSIWWRHHATGYLANAKSAGLYVQDIDKLVIIYLMVNTKTSLREVTLPFAAEIRQGAEMSVTIKTSGGMTHTRGITDSILAKWVHSLPNHVLQMIPYESFIGIQSYPTEQH